ncbi:saccharopine dehydrogenase NADP-binding domain-containing protein [Oligoflexaceae bacterium]|nr:saccharopine dehydrogenase NADP-binding domain-containing protein [Oligoflexaceae bacterium]
MAQQHDIVIYGATGFVGKLLCQYFDDKENFDLNWAIAGRSQSKLKKLRDGLNSDPAIIQADSEDLDSLRKLVSAARVVVSTVGPYAKYGSDLVRLCAEHGTHYCDLTGEVQWIHQMIQETDSVAAQSGARIVHCCGFDSIPSDIGCQVLQEEFHAKFGKPASEVKFGLIDAKGGYSGGTIASLINVLKEGSEDNNKAKVLADPCALNAEGRTWETANTKSGGNFDPDFGWTAPFVMASINSRIVRRSASLRPELYGDALEYQEYTAVGEGAGKFVKAQSMKIGTGLVMSVLGTETGRFFAEKFLPKAGEGPDEQLRKNGFFKIRMLGQAGDQKMNIQINGKGDPGYAATVRMLGTAAIFLSNGWWRKGSEPGNRTTSYFFDRRFADALGKEGISFVVGS